MTYVNCPCCGGRLLEGEEGSSVRLKCSKCGKLIRVNINSDKVILMTNETNTEEQNKKVC